MNHKVHEKRINAKNSNIFCKNLIMNILCPSFSFTFCPIKSMFKFFLSDK